jgi:GNAT superfamily N-acetyltransferase
MRELMRLHIEALYEHTAGGRLVRVNVPNGKEAPRFFLGRTAEGIEWRARHDLEDAMVRSLAAAVAAGGASFEPYERILAEAAPVGRRWAGPAYYCPPTASSAAVAVTAHNVELLSPYLEPWRPDVALGMLLLAVVVDGHAVSICGSVRTTGAADEAGVETVEQFRGRGYASQAVAAWAEAVRGQGRVPLYSTSWENAASQSVARKLGMMQFGDDIHLT